MLDLTEAGYTAKVKINGTEFPVRIGKPYAWDISSAVKDGKNTIEVTVANTLCNRVADDFSSFMPLSPAGLIGPVIIKKQQ